MYRLAVVTLVNRKVHHGPPLVTLVKALVRKSIRNTLTPYDETLGRCIRTRELLTLKMEPAEPNWREKVEMGLHT